MTSFTYFPDFPIEVVKHATSLVHDDIIPGFESDSNAVKNFQFQSFQKRGQAWRSVSVSDNGVDDEMI